MSNFVGQLQEKCQKCYKDPPTYEDLETHVTHIKKSLCKLYHFTTEGSGYNKKLARQNAAELMLKKIEECQFMKCTNSSTGDNVATTTAGTKVTVFAAKNGKEMPICSEKPKEDDLFIVECTFDKYTAVGKGRSKKAAKEMALEEIANHFNIHTFYDNHIKTKERMRQEKNSVQLLVELCQARKLTPPVFHDEPVILDTEKIKHFVVSCSVNELVVHSKPNFSKKNGKQEAAALMFDKLNNTDYFNTPDQSPFQSSEKNENGLLPEAELSSDDVPPVKRKKEC